MYLIVPECMEEETIDWLERIGYEIVDKEKVETITSVAIYDTWDGELDDAVFLSVEE